MQDTGNEFNSLLFKYINQQIPQQIQWAKVTEVDWNNKTCTAKDLDSGLEFFDVLLGIGSVYIKPKVGSLILLALIENDEAKPFLVSAKEIESYQIKTTDKIVIENENENLAKLMLDFIGAIRQMKFTTNTGSTIKLINDISFKMLEDRFKSLLN